MKTEICTRMLFLLAAECCFLVAAVSRSASAATETPSSAVSMSTSNSNNYSESSTDRGLVMTPSCHDVRQIFGMKDIGSIQLVPDTQIKGDGNELCPSPLSCCNPKMEERYKDAVKKDLRSMLQTASSYLKTLIATSAATFRESFLTMIRSSENQTLVLFTNVYQKMESATKSPVHQLFSSMASYIQGREIDLEDQVAIFFDTLFPLVYHLTINPKLKDFSEDYKECLRETREEIRPFGDVPQKLTTNLARSFGSARTFLQALSLGVEVINTTEHMDFGVECGKALVKLTYCPHCLGTVSAKPCGPYCLNVVRGCLSQVAELDRPWSDFVAALERMASGFVGAYNAEEVLAMVDTRISEAIMHAMENGPELSKKVKTACGHPKRATRAVSSLVQEPSPPLASMDNVTTTTTTASSTNMDAGQDLDGLELAVAVKPPKSGVSTRSAGSLLQRLQSFAKKLSESRSFYDNLADTLCNEDSMSPSGEQCWNGHAFGEYLNTIAGIGVTAQKYNPEFRPSKTVGTDSAVATLVDKLNHLKQILNSRASSVPQSDSYVVEGSGSGSYWNNRVGDDEDYNDGSGSGNGWDEEKTRPEDDFSFAGKDGKKTKTTEKGGNSSDVTKPSFAITCFVGVAFLVTSWCRQRQ